MRRADGLRAAGRGRRTALGLLCLLLALAGPAGCAHGTGEPRTTLSVLGPWTGKEEESFKKLLELFEEKEGVSVEYQGTTATREVLLTGVLAGDPPDIAVLPVLGDLADYAQGGALVELEKDLVDEVDEEGAYAGGPWLPQLVKRSRSPESSESPQPSESPDPSEAPTPSGRYWIPVKVDLKSIVWYEKRHGEPDVSRQGDPGRDVTRWCIGMGSDATSGWPGSDWIEDILLQQSGADAYDEWATGRGNWTDDAVVEAWRTWGEFMSGGGGEAGEAARQALITDHRGPEGGTGLLFDDERDCDLEHQGSFARSLYGRDARHADFVPSPRLLPGADPKSTAREVSGDFAAMFRDSPQARKLMRFLASSEAQRAWTDNADAPSFSARKDIKRDMYSEDDAVSRRIVREFREAERLCLDASDVMPPMIRRVFHEKVLEFLADPGQEPTRLLKQIQEVQDKLPKDTLWLKEACG